MILLAGLFVYDIFWVFCTPVMVSVAKSFDAPIKLLFKRAGDTGPLPFRCRRLTHRHHRSDCVGSRLRLCQRRAEVAALEVVAASC